MNSPAMYISNPLGKPKKKYYHDSIKLKIL